ncbi:Gfo/Idh/MocA family oxidoreductase [Acidobacteria bacterium AH-259-L09]|nr:Gfo/Idh/MocA family oxidoreductase [Acidobacteria bacterium AH-259-L09]
MHRRTFLKGTLGTACAAVTVNLSVARGGSRILGANERFRIAICGLNGRGKKHMNEFSGLENVEIAYLVDPDRKVLERAVASLKEKLGGSSRVQGLTDVRKALEDKTIDAISVATPNHWHSLMTIWAAQSAKHCYVEKPASHDIYEGRIAVEAWKKYGVVIQHGTQRRSDSSLSGLHDAIRGGKFGKLAISYGYCCKPRDGIGFEKAGDPPSHLDWDLWRGPAKIKKFHANFVHYDWHWFWKTGNGDLNNQGTHQLDVAQWALDRDVVHPVRVMALGGRFLWKDQAETPNTMFAIAEYPNGQSVFFNVRNVNYKGYERQVENEYYFKDGGKIIRGKYYPRGSTEAEKISIPAGKVTPGGAFGSFVAACRAGKPEMSNADMMVAHQSCVLGHLMNISYRLGKKLPFNARAGRFGDNKSAYEHFMKFHEIMRDGCGTPEDKEKYIVGPWLHFDPATERFTGEWSSDANALLRDSNRKGFKVPDAGKV